MPADPHQEGYMILTFAGENVTEYFSNFMGTVHGTAISSWVDILTSMAIFGFDKLERPRHVSLSLNTNFIAGCRMGKSISFVCTVMKSTRNIAFTRCEIYDDEKRLTSTSTHKKMYINHEGKL